MTETGAACAIGSGATGKAKGAALDSGENESAGPESQRFLALAFSSSHTASARSTAAISHAASGPVTRW